MWSSDRSIAGYDAAMAPLEWLVLRRLRKRLVSALRGCVLEIAAGTGANLPFYNASVCLIATDVSAEALAAASGRRHAARVTLLRADAEGLPLLAHSVDHAVATLAFCSIPDPARALAELRRVLRPGGTLVLLEHVQGEGWLAGGLTRALASSWHAFTRSCRIDRRTTDAVRQAGFSLRSERRYLGGIVRMVTAASPA